MEDLEVADRRCTLVFGCMCAWMLCVSTAKAADGRISFAGSIVVSTCLVATGDRTMTRSSVRSRRSCGDQGLLSASVRAYIETARQITHAEPDRVLNYFEGYVARQQALAVPMLVTRTYE